MDNKRPLAGATTALRNNLCEFPAMFAKCVMVGLADEFHTATATLIDLGRGPLAVTCAHVMTDYLERWRSGKAVVQIGNTRMSESQIRGLDTDVDLATFRLTDEQAADLVREDGITTQFYQPSRWPPACAEKDEWVAIGRYPAEWRQNRSETREIILAYYGIGATRVTSASERHFGCRFEREHWVWMSRSAELSDLTMLGGLSGGPVFAERHLHRALVGIVTDFRSEWDIMLIAHAHWIREDGSILENRPWLPR